jgi:energy-converting hydrogenase A subunit M
MKDVVNQIMAYEQGDMDDEEVIDFFQTLLDTRIIYSLQGSYQRQAHALLEAGYIERTHLNDA